MEKVKDRRGGEEGREEGGRSWGCPRCPACWSVHLPACLLPAAAHLLPATACRELEDERNDVRKVGHMGNFYANLLTKNVAYGTKGGAAGGAGGSGAADKGSEAAHTEGAEAGAAACGQSGQGGAAGAVGTGANAGSSKVPAVPLDR